MLRQATRLLGGTAALAAGGWVLRAAHDAPAALGAAQDVIAAVAQGSPNFRDGRFVNREQASGVSLNREEQTMLVRDLFLGRNTGRPGGTSGSSSCERRRPPGRPGRPRPRPRGR